MDTPIYDSVVCDLGTPGFGWISALAGFRYPGWYEDLLLDRLAAALQPIHRVERFAGTVA